MAEERFISVDEFCVSHSVEISFISRLEQIGLIQTTIREKSTFVALENLPVLEKIVRMHYDLDINLEGIETIMHLLDKVEGMRSEILVLENKLRRYEE